jgi:putative ABC transport system permease protein
MDKKFIIKLAAKNLLTHKMRSILMILGMSIGIAAIIFLVSFAFGLERLVTQEITKGDAFKLIDVGTGNSQIIKIDGDVLTKLSKIYNVKAAEAIISAGAKVEVNNRSTDTAFVGATPNYLDWSGVKITWGKDLSLDNDIIVSTAFINFLGGKDPNSYLNKKYSFNILLTSDLTADGNKKTIENQEFMIKGVFKDDANVIVYTKAQGLAALGAVNYSKAKVEVSSPSQIQAVRRVIENMGLKTQYVGDTVSQVERIFSIFKIILLSFGLIALIVASIGMFNVLTISFLERIREIALMRILGARRRDIRAVFLAESIIVGFLSGFLGVIIALILSSWINSLFSYFARAAGGTNVAIFYAPLWFILVVFLFSFLVALLTGLYPARRASKVNALDVLRYE